MSFGIKSPEGTWYNTTDKDIADLAKRAKQEGRPLTIQYAVNGSFRNIEDAFLETEVAQEA